MFGKIKKLIRDSNPMNHKPTFVEKCLKGNCSKIKEELETLLTINIDDASLKKELGLDDDEYLEFIEAENYYETFQNILINRVINKRRN